jgi:hypothetical protein
MTHHMMYPWFARDNGRVEVVQGPDSGQESEDVTRNDAPQVDERNLDDGRQTGDRVQDDEHRGRKNLKTPERNVHPHQIQDRNYYSRPFSQARGEEMHRSRTEGSASGQTPHFHAEGHLPSIGPPSLPPNNQDPSFQEMYDDAIRSLSQNQEENSRSGPPSTSQRESSHSRQPSTSQKEPSQSRGPSTIQRESPK